MQETRRIPKDIIKQFENEYKENVIKPTITLNGFGDIISYVYSKETSRDAKLTLTDKIYARRMYHTKSTMEVIGKYGIVYMEKLKIIRYDYMFYDEIYENMVQTFFEC